VITNINERNYPGHPYGKFAFVAPGSQAKVPEGAVRIELNSSKAKLLGRVELEGDREGAVALQKEFKFKLTVLGTPEIRPPVPIPSFGNENLLGVEIFEQADAIIDSAHDVSPVAPQMQARARHYARMARDPSGRAALDAAIRTKVVPEFLGYAVTKSGVFRNH